MKVLITPSDSLHEGMGSEKLYKGKKVLAVYVIEDDTKSLIEKVLEDHPEARVVDESELEDIII